MKRQVLICFYFFMTYFGVIKFFYWLNRRKKIILTYHNIIPDNLFDNSLHLGVSHTQSIFEKQIQLIRRRFMSNSKGKYVNRCLITFDDGYKNQLEVAAKILNHHNLQGIFFVSFQSVSTGQALTIDKVMMWMSYIPAGNYRLMGNVIEINDSNRCANASRLYEQLLKDYKLWDVIENELNNAFSFDSLPINSEYARLRFKPFDFNDLKILAEKGHLVGSHSWNHIPLSILPAEKQKEDFSLCVHFANKYCNSMLYSYPFGGIQEVSPATTTLCQEYGFSAAYLNIPEPPQWLNVNKNYILSRINLPNEKNKYLLDAKLSGFESFCKKASKKIRFIVDNITCHFQLSQKA